MKKDTIKGIIIGAALTTAISTSIVIADDVFKTIEVLPNTMTVVVNGNKVNADNFLYDGTTYLPIRAVSEALGKDVQYDDKTRTATISEKKESDNINNQQITGKYIPEEKYINNDYFVRIYNNTYYIHPLEYIREYTDEGRIPNGAYWEWYDDKKELVITKDKKEVYRCKPLILDDIIFIPYDTFVDEVLPKLQ